MLNLISHSLIILSFFFIFFGVLGLFRFRDFYSRILISAKVETVGFITLMVGIMIGKGFSFFSLKVLFLLFIVVVTNPISTHAIARSAVISGYKINKERSNDS